MDVHTWDHMLLHTHKAKKQRTEAQLLVVNISSNFQVIVLTLVWRNSFANNTKACAFLDNHSNDTLFWEDVTLLLHLGAAWAELNFKAMRKSSDIAGYPPSLHVFVIGWSESINAFSFLIF